MGNSHDLYDQILNSAPSQRTLLLILSKLKEEGDIDRVIQECLKALAVYPNDVHIRRLLAESYLEKNQISSAEDELKKTMELLSDLADVHKLHAEICGNQGRNEEADEALKIYLAYHPKDEEALRMYDEIHIEEEPSAGEFQPSPEEIATTFEEQLEEEPPEIATPTLAEIYFKQGELQKAKDTYRTLIELHPEDTHLRERLEALETIDQEKASDQEIRDTQLEKTQRAIAILESWRANILENITPY
jgi:tetratricopeptide (TPR) repeat protein